MVYGNYVKNITRRLNIGKSVLENFIGLKEYFLESFVDLKKSFFRLYFGGFEK